MVVSLSRRQALNLPSQYDLSVPWIPFPFVITSPGAGIRKDLAGSGMPQDLSPALIMLTAIGRCIKHVEQGDEKWVESSSRRLLRHQRISWSWLFGQSRWDCSLALLLYCHWSPATIFRPHISSPLPVQLLGTFRTWNETYFSCIIEESFENRWLPPAIFASHGSRLPCTSSWTRSKILFQHL